MSRSRQIRVLRRLDPRAPITLAVITVITCTSIIAFSPSGFLAGLLVGGFLVTVLGVVWFWVLLVSGSAWILMGAMAERWTAQGLRPLTKHGWRLLNHVQLTTRDMDHVLLGPGGAYVVETKWRGSSWPDEVDDRLRSAAHQAATDAKRLAMWHGFKELEIKTRPVVVLWDPAERKTHESCQYWIEGVVLIRGCCLPEWTAALPTGELGRAKVAAASAVLTGQIGKRDQHERSRAR